MCFKVFFLILLLLTLTLPCSAEIEVDLGGAVEVLPDNSAELLPDEFFEGDTESVAKGLEKILDFTYFWELLRSLFIGGLKESVPAMLTLFSVLVVSALLTAFKDSLRSEALSGAVGLASAAVMTALLVKGAASHVEAVESFLSRLSQLCVAMIPVMGGLLASGGSVGAAAATGGGVLVILGAVEAVVGGAFGSIVGVSLALSAANVFSSRLKLSALARAVRRGFGIFFGVVTSLLGFLVSLKIGIASAGDSVAMRGARIFAQNAIPLVGSAVSGTLGTLASALSYMKSVSGTVGVVILLMLALPVFATVWTYRCGLVLLSGAAEMLGCERERELLTGVISVYGYMLAVIALTAVVFILILTLFTRCTLAFGGGI